MGTGVRAEITTTLLSLMSSNDDGLKTTAAVSIGCLISSLPEAELTDILLNHVLSE